MASAVENAVERAFKSEWGRVVATLIRRTGDWDLAEECAQEAFTQALARWPHDGVPRQPGAWLTTVASNRALDRLRRAQRGSDLLERVASDAARDSGFETDPFEAVEDEEVIEDDRLRLIFTCCHPALSLEGRVALTLRALAGLTTAEIASAFLVPEATMAKRLSRAKSKIAGAGIPYRVPPAEMLPDRVGGVLAVLYLLFNEGYAASGGEQLIRAALCAEAIRLARLLARLMPDEPEALGLLALMLLNDSRREARLGSDGALIILEEQDRSRWNETEIAEGLALLDKALRSRAAGSYQLQAAIVACHARAATAEDTDWAEISRLYGLLREQLRSPIVELNRAVAIAMAGDIDAGLLVVDGLAKQGKLADYHLLEATRADLLRRRGNLEAAAVAYGRALEGVHSEPERRFLVRRLREVSLGG